MRADTAPSWITISLLLAATAGAGCGDGGPRTGDGPTEPDASTSTLRFTRLELIAPHAYAFGALDITSTINERLGNAMVTDTGTPPDGDLDLSIALRLPSKASNARTPSPVELMFPRCNTQAGSMVCRHDPDSILVETLASNKDTTCLEVPGSIPASPPCFVTEAMAFTAPIGSVIVRLEHSQIGATYSGDRELVNGVFRGFLTEAAASNTIIPDSVPLFGGMPLATLLRTKDMDNGPGDQPGWWLSISFSATAVELEE